MRKILIVLFMTLMLPTIQSCGRNNSNNCRNKETMRIECRAVNQPTYGYGYAQEMCDRSYNSDRCY
jgi:hypothetical protein